MKFIKMIGWIFLLATIVAVAVICLQVDDWNRDWTQNEAELPAIEVDATPDETLECLQKWADANLSWKVVSTEPSDTGTKLHFTHTTGFFKFVDDIHVEVVSAGDHAEVSASSKSRVGKGDLGQNPRNLKKLAAALVPLGKHVAIPSAPALE